MPPFPNPSISHQQYPQQTFPLPFIRPLQQRHSLPRLFLVRSETLCQLELARRGRVAGIGGFDSFVLSSSPGFEAGFTEARKGMLGYVAACVKGGEVGAFP